MVIILITSLGNRCPIPRSEAPAVQFRSGSNTGGWSDEKFAKHAISIGMDWRTGKIAWTLCHWDALPLLVSIFKLPFWNYPIRIFGDFILIQCLISSFRMFVSLIKYMCLSLVPLAAITSLATHFLISYDQIQVIDSPTSAVTIIEKAAEKITNHVSDIGIKSDKKFVG